MIDWNLVITTSIISTSTIGIIVGLLVFVFKSKISQELEKKLDQFRSQLQIIALEHQIRYTHMYNRRAEIIDNLYKLIVQTEERFTSMAAIIEFPNQPSKQEKAKLASDSARELVNYFTDNEIYFDEELSNKLSNLLRMLEEVYRNFQVSQDDKSGRSVDLWIDAWTKVKQDVPILKRVIKEEFQKIIGISSQ